MLIKVYSQIQKTHSTADKTAEQNKSIRVIITFRCGTLIKYGCLIQNSVIFRELADIIDKKTEYFLTSNLTQHHTISYIRLVLYTFLSAVLDPVHIYMSTDT